MFVASWFEVLVAKPIFNLLVLIYGLIPGHNFGLAIILFTILIRVLMWPMVRKQLHQTKLMRQLQPELKRIKKAAAGDRQKEGLMMQELYKERGINPFGSIGMLIVQVIILLALYSGLKKVINDPSAIISNSYTWIRNLPWLQTLSADIGKFDATLFGVVDLSRAAVNTGGGLYWPAMFLVLGSAVAQFFQSGQLMPKPKDGKRLRDILKDANSGKQADTSEVNAAVMGGTRYFLPVMIVLFTINIASALSLYWFVGGIVAYIQQAKVLGDDEAEMEVIADQAPAKGSSATRLRNAVEAELVTTNTTKSKSKKSSHPAKSSKKSNKRRK